MENADYNTSTVRFRGVASCRFFVIATWHFEWEGIPYSVWIFTQTCVRAWLSIKGSPSKIESGSDSSNIINICPVAVAYLIVWFGRANCWQAEKRKVNTTWRSNGSTKYKILICNAYNLLNCFFAYCSCCISVTDCSIRVSLSRSPSLLEHRPIPKYTKPDYRNIN